MNTGIEERCRIIPSDDWSAYSDIVARATMQTPPQVRALLGSMVKNQMVEADDHRPSQSRSGRSVRRYRLRSREAWGRNNQQKTPPPQNVAAAPMALAVGNYTINVHGWTFANDTGATVELHVAALHVTADRAVVHKKIVLEDAAAKQKIRAWLAAQAGIVPDTAAIEQERDAALKLAEEAEQRARNAEAQLARIKQMIGGA